jgi:hypothetical protein
MALQTVYATAPTALLLGAIPDQRNPEQDRSMTVETVAGLAFGVAVGYGAADKGILAIATGQATVFAGVTIRDTAREADLYARYDEAAVRRKGPIVVQASVAVDAGDPAYIVPATGVFTDDSTSNILVGTWESTTAGAGLAILNLN